MKTKCNQRREGININISFQCYNNDSIESVIILIRIYARSSCERFISAKEARIRATSLLFFQFAAVNAFPAYILRPRLGCCKTEFAVSVCVFVSLGEIVDLELIHLHFHRNERTTSLPQINTVENSKIYCQCKNKVAQKTTVSQDRRIRWNTSRRLAQSMQRNLVAVKKNANLIENENQNDFF